MECDAAGANIYHIIVRGNTFHSYFFLSFTFNFLFILEGRGLWQLKLISYMLRASLHWLFTEFVVEAYWNKTVLGLNKND